LFNNFQKVSAVKIIKQNYFYVNPLFRIVINKKVILFYFQKVRNERIVSDFFGDQ